MNTTFTTYAEKKAKQFLNLLQGYTKGIRITAILILLLLGVSNAWAGAGFWDNGGITLTFTVNTSSVTRTLNSGSQGGETSLGTVTTAMTLTSVKANVWKDGGNICSVNMFYQVKNSSGTVVFDKSGIATALSYSSYENKNQVWQNTNVNVDLMNGGLAPGTYTFECWFSATGSYNDGGKCDETFWYSNKDGSNYKYTFIIPSKKLTVSGDANGNTVSGTVTGITKGKAYTITATPTTGYSFSKWTASSGASSITIANANAASTTVTFKDYANDATVTASFSAKTYTVTLDNQGATTAGAASVTATYNAAMPSIANNLPKKTGYTFNGYFDAKSDGTKYYNADGSSAKNWDKTTATTLYAQWTAITITATLTPTEGTIGANNLTFSITSNAPTNSGYVVGVYNFGEDNNAGGELSGVTPYNNNPQTHTGTPNFVKAGTYYTRAFIMLNAVTLAESDKIAFVVRDGGTPPDPEELTWKMYDGDTELGTFINEGNDTYKLTITIPEGGYATTNYRNNLGWVSAPGANSLLTTVETLVNNNGRIAWKDGAGKFTITIRKEGEVWKISAVKVVGAIDITSCPEYLTTSQSLELGYRFDGIPSTWKYQVCSQNTTTSVDACYNQLTDMPISSPSTFTSTEGLSEGVHEVVIKVYDGEQLMLKSEPKIVTVERFWEVAVYKKVNNIETHVRNISPTEHIGVEITAENIAGYQFTGWSANTPHITIDNQYSTTTIIKAAAGGRVYANYKKLEPKTIYLKTVEGTTDGVKWYVKYNDTEYLMDELGCTNEYYKGVVPEGTSFQFVSRDASNNIVETKGTDLQYVEGKTLYNLVSAAASGDKIFFKPNSHWKNHSTHKYFVARFWAGSAAVIKDLIDNDGDGIYECEKPAGAIEVYFCLTKAQASASSGQNWPSDAVAHTNNDVREGFKDGKNLFTLGEDQTVDGNNDTGTWSEFADTPVNGEGEWTIFEGATYRITFDHAGATSGTTTPGIAYVDAQYNSAMPTIESLPKNTDWKFAGYYTAANGGTAITNAFGDWLNVDEYISNGKWVKEECVTLYAHWVVKTPEITNVALSKNVFDVGSVEAVTATPTVVRHSYQGNFTICWKLLDNSGTVMDLFPFTPGNNNSVSFSVDGLTSGTYTVRASIYASACDTGEELSRFDAKITIVSGYKVTVKYLCGDNVIKVSDIYPGHATTPTPITAPEIGGYKFVNWELGDGIFSESDLKSETIEYTAIYDGYLTAKYEKRKLIFLDLSTLKTKANWTAPHIYLYKGAKGENTGGYWNDQTGAGGATGGNCITHAAMTKVPNTENIWYFDYENYTNNFNAFVAFTSNNQGNSEHFANCEAIYRTEFSSGTPVFVPASDQTAETKNSTAKYYSKGYWVKYMDGTGYWMIIYNEAGDTELVRREFTSDTQRMTMTSIVDLEAEHTYKYEIYRNDGYYYNGGDITYTNSSTYRPLNEANKHSIKTTETGDYTFTLNYEKGDLQIKVQYPGEVGDYRILYTDDVRNKRYKPSQIISQNNKEPLVSFFVRPNNNPVLKIQKATLVTEEEVKWDNNVLYLTPHNDWKSDGARFAAYFYNNNSGNKWVDMTSIKNGVYYGCAIPEGTWTNVIFCRMNPNIQENGWNQNGEGPVWNQTVNLTIPTNNGNNQFNNQFTITNPWDDWHEDKATGTWSKHNNDIIDLSEELKKKLGELDLTNIKADTGTVFNIHLSNNSGTPTIEKVAFYTGNYYIRVDAVDGKWYDYKTNPDNLMTYSAFSESDENSFGEKFSHYKTKWCTREKGTMNVKFVIANDYSLCISDTLTQDEGNPFGNIDEHGNITNDGKYDANIRFMWNRHTNKVSRAYVAGASGNNTRFLVLKANQTIHNESGQAINNNEVVFKDTQNWLYERTIKVQPGTLVKLIAYYPDGNKAQYFRGTSDNGFEENVSAVKILGGNSEEWYTMRLIYDFKTNRLMGAWVPDQNINDTLEIDADIMVIRQHQEDATYITFANDKSQLSNVKTVYGVMRFNRWTLNNRSTSDHKVLPVQDQKSIYERALYFISFPFDVHLSDVFGFGTYGTHWVISEYNGLRRAKNGYFVDNCMNEDCTNWDYIWDPSNFTMKANQGYLLSLDLDLMKSDNTSFWAHDIQQVELFFPSFAPVETIKQTSYTMPALSEEDYKCKHKGHEVIDSYWRCIGVPSFADYNSALTTDGTNKITWKPKDTQMPYLYEWNVSDNSLMVRAASTYRFRPTYAYLVQNGNQIHWSAVNATPNQPSNIVARRQAADEVKNYEWKLTLSRNEQIEDQAFVRLSYNEQITTEFDFNQDLSKEFNYGRSDIYTLIGYEKAAANSLPLSEQTTLIPVGLSIEYNGDYTIAMPGRMENIGVTLIDTESNTRTNLSAGMEYTLTLNKGDYNNRFFIEISPIQQTPTDIEYVTGDSNSQNSVRKVLIDNILYIVRDGQIFDARGARVK